ncbi:related to ZIP family zinc transporter [Ramularia collo-cygni]|uniref:Related to ZIP family zinc transporter n=1 Tax=Ramularia collo-cygni TaxID=112498 RepID=A0A2D3V3G4_9PEZI|nr:related to ZIP family zinc transporter [Ramularia collo-cygni]CZT19227.1 related to ZIP family zinc transporter [Ramularia collo-cygni]
MTQDGVTEPIIHTIPLALLRAELQRRQQQQQQQQQDPPPRPTCGSNKSSTTPYNIGIHVFALFLILTLSTLACSLPLIVRRFPSLPVPNKALFISRHFGTGVLIATAFVHLLPTAYTNLTDPCLPPFWTDTYPAMPGFIAMCSVLVVVGIEMFFATRGAGHSHKTVDFQRRGTLGGGGRQVGGYRDVSNGDISSASVNKPLPRTPPRDRDDEDEEDSDLDLDELDPAVYEEEEEDTQPLTGHRSSSDDNNNNATLRPKHTRKVSWAHSHANNHSHSHSHHIDPNSPSEQRAVLQCLMLEAGILFHSIFIGLALSVSTGSSFIVLLIAISFHQTFEGLALGSRIAAIASFSTSSPKPWLMSLMYGITTPVGQALGLGLQGFYDPMSMGGLLMVGIVNAVSCGLLMYAGLVQLLAEDFLSEESYVELFGRRRLLACGSVVGGAMLMALVGVWA